MGRDLDFPIQYGVNAQTAMALLNKDWPQYETFQKSVTFVATTNGNGDYDGTGNPSALLTVTGVVELSIIALCTVDLAGANATIKVGTAKSTAGLIAQATATDIDVDDIWHDATPDSSIELTSVVTRKIVSEDVIITVATANITSGAITFVVRWAPISSDGNVVAA